MNQHSVQMEAILGLVLIKSNFDTIFTSHKK